MATKAQNQEKFLEAYAECPNRQYACNAVPIKLHTFHSWMRTDEAFRRRYLADEEVALDYLEETAYSRAVIDDTMNRWLLARRRPEKWADPVKKHQVEHSGGIQVVLDFGGTDADKSTSQSDISSDL